MLNFFDSDQNALATLITGHNGYTGESSEKKIYMKNSDSSLYYKNITVSPRIQGELDQGNIFSTTGWSIKLKYGSERPSEDEWSEVLVNDTLSMPDIGSTNAADTATYHPIWVRIYCPGGTDPQIKKNMSLSVSYEKRLVNA